MQGTDNRTYVNTNVEGVYALSGSIFLDYRNNSESLDPVSIIYGHDMTGGKMFGNLPKYAENDYFREHSTGSLYLGGKSYVLRVVAYMLVDAYDMSVYDVSVTQENMGDYISNLEVKSTVRDTSELANSNKLLLLSTCNSSQTNGRSVVVCRIAE